jgi:cell division protein FtsL
MASWAAAWPQRMSEALGARMGATVSATLGAAAGTARPGVARANSRRYMPGAPEIYFRKSIDNSRLVRAVDLVAKREMRLFTATVVICFLMALVYLGQHCSSIEYGYKIEDLRAQCDQAAEVNRTLRLEEATLKDPARINALASNMGMALPAVGQVERLGNPGVRDSGAPVMARADSIAVISVPN